MSRTRRWGSGLAWCVALALLPTACARLAFAETVRLPVTQDNSIVLVDGEWTENAGTNARIRIKGNQHLVALGFDPTPLRGRLVRRAELVCQAAAETISGVTISTIAAPWDELKSNGLTSGAEEFAGWGYPGARFPAVVGGNAFTLTHRSDAPLRDGVYRWEIPADLVHALAVGAAHGLAIHEHSADYGRNPTIYSREQSGKQPYLEVELDEGADAAPLPASELSLVPIDDVSARLRLRAPSAGFAYEVTVDGHLLPRHNIPWVRSGETQVIPLRDLPATVAQPGTHTVEVVTISRTGSRSRPASVQGELFTLAAPESLDLWLPGTTGTPVSGLAVIPVTDKYDQSGRPVGSLPDRHRQRNSVFDGDHIFLTAAAGEVVGFQVLLRGAGEVSLQLEFAGPPLRTDLFQAVYVPAEGRLIPDPLLPLPNRIPLSNDADQSVFADIYVPFDAPPGRRSGTLTISDGRQVPIGLTILPVRLPRRASFACEMNSYGLPDHVDDYYALQQVAYDHRVHANILHYSHHTAAPGSRKSNLDMRLRSGRRMDNRRYDSIQPGAKQGWWDDFAEAFGPFLDGSCFAQGHRGPIPAPGFYLTFHESWPLNCREFFNGDPDAYRAFADRPVYAETYAAVLADFARLAKDRGWTETGFQVYFNNKGSLAESSKAPWVLDEPASFWDYRALQYYGELTDRGRRGAGDVRIDYRIDISRPEFCRGELAGRSDLWVVSSWAVQHYRRLVTDRMERDALKVWVYGTTNPVHESNRQVVAWALDAWREGATGVVPWQTVDKTGEALRRADQLGLFIFDQDAAGKTIIRHSARLKAYRDAEQLIEYLRLVQQRRGWSPSQLRAFVQRHLSRARETRLRDADDAGTAEYDSRALLQLDALRSEAIALLR